MISMIIEDKKFAKEVEAFIKKKDREFRKHIQESTIEMHNDAVTGAPHTSNFLRHSIRIITPITLTGVVVSAANYSQAVEEGTKPHRKPIVPKNKKVLAGHRRYAPVGWKMFSGDYAIYGKKVWHPGTRPQPFMFPAWKKAIDRLYSLIGKSL